MLSFITLDPLFAALASVLTLAYHVAPSYGAAVLGLTLVVSLITLPLNYRSMRARGAMAKLQPRLAELRRRHKNDQQRLTAETKALFKEHDVSPLGGCLPALVQMPLFIAMYRLLRGLTHSTGPTANFRPRYLSHGSRLYKALAAGHTMRGWGVDLAQTASAALHASPESAAVVGLLIAITLVAGVVQSRLASGGRRPAARSVGDRALALTPALFGLWTLSLPVGVGLYYAVSIVLRLGQQWAFVRVHPLA
jgi:YidC/Oxa1 family membrane protein insertase